jgi:uncharacterized membrane protein
MLSKVYLWHPIFVHFSVALLSLAAIFFTLSAFFRRPILRRQWIVVAEWNLWVGLGLSVLTALFGWLAFSTVNHDDVSHELMETHAAFALVTVGVFALAAVWSWRQRKTERYPSWLFLGLIAVGFSLLMITGLRGGELVYMHGLAVTTPQKPEEPNSTATTTDQPKRTHEHPHGTVGYRN